MKFISNTYTCFGLKYESYSFFYLMHYILSNTLYDMRRDNVCTMISYWKSNVLYQFRKCYLSPYFYIYLQNWCNTFDFNIYKKFPCTFCFHCKFDLRNNRSINNFGLTLIALKMRKDDDLLFRKSNLQWE